MELLPIIRTLQIGAMLLLAGSLAFEVLVLRRASGYADPAIDDTVRGWLRVIRLICLYVGLLSWLAWLGLLSIKMSGLPPSKALTVDVLRTVLMRTTFGRVWSIRAGLFAVVAAQLAFPWRVLARRSYFGVLLSVTAPLGLICTLAWTGHALGTHPAHLLVDVIHLLAAALWIGMIPPLWFVVRRAPSSPAWSALALTTADRFFWPGIVAVIAVAGSGLANASWLIGSATAVFTTTYGLLLAAKVSVFLVMVLLAINNRSITRRLRRHGSSDDPRAGLRALFWSITFELTCGIAVIVLVAVLGVTAPPAHEHLMHQMNGM
jgi:copper resistance protein D